MKRPLSFIVFLMLVLLSGCFGSRSEGLSDGNIALIEIKGVIIEPDTVVSNLERARKNRNIKAVVVRVDSPGGSVGASQEIFRTMRNLDKIKPVIVSMGDVAASGGYYVSAAARKVFANEGTVTGSLGVIMQHFNVGRLLELIRLDPETLKSGEFKDIASPYRSIQPEEKKLLDDFLAEIHEQFKKDVADSRGLEKEVVDKLADGRIYTGATAVKLGLVDEIGGYVEAVKEAAKSADIKGEPKVVKIKKKTNWFIDLLGDDPESLLENLRAKLDGYKYFLYKLDL